MAICLFLAAARKICHQKMLAQMQDTLSMKFQTKQADRNAINLYVGRYAF